MKKVEFENLEEANTNINELTFTLKNHENIVEYFNMFLNNENDVCR
jgi:hypothetical protein